jgi:hypothetical protein
MAKHRITVLYNVFLQVDGVWRLQVWASETENMTGKIFVYQHKRQMPYNSTPRDVFVNIAQPSDIEEYPEDTPGDVFPFFRKESIDLEINDSRLTYNTIGRLAKDIADLCTGLDRIS